MADWTLDSGSAAVQASAATGSGAAKDEIADRTSGEYIHGLGKLPSTPPFRQLAVTGQADFCGIDQQISFSFATLTTHPLLVFVSSFVGLMNSYYCKAQDDLSQDGYVTVFFVV
jgi:hypothetical protein